MLAPRGVLFLPVLGSRRHSFISKCCIRSTEISFVEMSLESWNTVQEFLFGSGKSELNKVSSWLSEWQCHFGSLPNDRKGMSVI